jgi:menaquinone-dependent protoporphyrinogen IX oxidase
MRESKDGGAMTDTTSAGRGERPPRVLLLYYSYTGQSQKVLEAAGEVFRGRGCEVQKAEIEFTDQRYAEKFSRFPMRRVWPDMISVLPAQKRGATGEIRIPDTVRDGDYDLICIGSPTWWQTVSMPMRSFLKSDEAAKLLSGTPFAVFVVCRQFWRENSEAVRELAEQQGGQYVDEIHFTYPGDPLRSMLSLTSYLGSGEYRDRYLGIRIPSTNVQPGQLEQTRTFAARLADRLLGKGSAVPGEETVQPR